MSIKGVDAGSVGVGGCSVEEGPINQLPPEILEQIFAHLGDDRRATSCVNYDYKLLSDEVNARANEDHFERVSTISNIDNDNQRDKAFLAYAESLIRRNEITKAVEVLKKAVSMGKATSSRVILKNHMCDIAQLLVRQGYPDRAVEVLNLPLSDGSVEISIPYVHHNLLKIAEPLFQKGYLYQAMKVVRRMDRCNSVTMCIDSEKARTALIEGIMKQLVASGLAAEEAMAIIDDHMLHNGGWRGDQVWSNLVTAFAEAGNFEAATEVVEKRISRSSSRRRMRKRILKEHGDALVEAR